MKGISQWRNYGLKYKYFDYFLGQMRQWLNEERITDQDKMVSDEDLLKWFK